jgi:hypothetical protein
MKQHLVDIATEKYPLRCSSLGDFVQCPWRVTMLMLATDHDKSGEAADTGSATHAAVAAWVKQGRNKDAALASMKSRIAEYPFAILTEATAMFEGYINDERNHCEYILCEEKIRVTLPPHETDKTKKEVVIWGTLDQVRKERGVLKVWDIKTSKKQPIDVLNYSTYQIAGYVIGAQQKLGVHVEPGGVILPRKYLGSGGPTHMETAWTARDIPLFLDTIRLTVANIRNHHIPLSPGDYCRFCIAQSPGRCIPLLRTIKNG